MKPVFLDTSFAISLSVKSDLLHPRAVQLAEQMRLENAKLVTTRAVILEIGNSLSKLRYRRAAILLLESLEQDSQVDIIEINTDLYEKAFELFCTRPDKERGLVDCISFVVMTQNQIQQALSADHHFLQAGFEALLVH
jgi:uncharacterized protein